MLDVDVQDFGAAGGGLGAELAASVGADFGAVAGVAFGAADDGFGSERVASIMAGFVTFFSGVVTTVFCLTVVSRIFSIDAASGWPAAAGVVTAMAGLADSCSTGRLSSITSGALPICSLPGTTLPVGDALATG